MASNEILHQFLEHILEALDKKAAPHAWLSIVDDAGKYYIAALADQPSDKAEQEPVCKICEKSTNKPFHPLQNALAFCQCKGFTNTASKESAQVALSERERFQKWYSDIAPDERSVNNYQMADAAWQEATKQARSQVERVPEWISASKPPENEGDYIVTCDDGTVRCDRFQIGKDWKQWWIEPHAGVIVTHYMKLPAAPSPAQEGE